MSEKPIPLADIDVARFVVQWAHTHWLVLLGNMPLFIETNWARAIELAAKRANILGIDGYDASVKVFNKDRKLVFSGTGRGALQWSMSPSKR